MRRTPFLAIVLMSLVTLLVVCIILPLTESEVSTKELNELLNTSKSNIIKGVGKRTENGAISVVGSHMVFPVISVKDLGLTLVFPNETDDFTPTYIIVNEENNPKGVNVNGAKPGMDFKEIISKLGENQVIKTWISNEENVVYKLDYVIEGVVYSFVSYEENGKNSVLYLSLEKSKEKIDNKNTQFISPLTDEDFVIKDENNYIELGGKYADFNTNESIVKTALANEKHVYNVYVFEDFKILTQPTDSADKTIFSIDITSSSIKTFRGVSVGDKVEKVVEYYGNPDEISKNNTDKPEQYTYSYNGKYFTFLIDENGKVIEICFDSV